MHLHHLTPKPRYFNQDRENSPKPLSPEKRTDTSLFISPGALPEGRGREKGRDRRESKRIHSTSQTEENWGGRSGSSQQAACWEALGGSAEAACLHFTRGGEQPPAPRRGVGAGTRLPNCWRLAAIGAMLAACAVRGAGAAVRGAEAAVRGAEAAVRGAGAASHPPPPVPSDLPGALNALPCCPPALRSHSARARVFSSVVWGFFKNQNQNQNKTRKQTNKPPNPETRAVGKVEEEAARGLEERGEGKLRSSPLHTDLQPPSCFGSSE